MIARNRCRALRAGRPADSLDNTAKQSTASCPDRAPVGKQGPAPPRQEESMKGIKSIGHVAIRVKDIERSLDFYVKKLDFAEMFRLHRDGKLWIVYLRITDSQFLELFPDAEGERAPGETMVGLNHVCLECDDIDLVIAQLAERGVPLFRPKKVGADNNTQAWIEDPDGNRIELMQLGADAMQTAAIRRLATA
jgi:lactoylglutathione lyase